MKIVLMTYGWNTHNEISQIVRLLKQFAELLQNAGTIFWIHSFGYGS